MAKGKKTGGRNFALGNRANPNGRPMTPDDVRQAQKVVRSQFLLAAQKYLVMSKEELKAAASDPKATSMDLMIAGIISKAVNMGCPSRMNFLLERLIGKVPQTVDLDIEHKNVQKHLVYVAEFGSTVEPTDQVVADESDRDS